MTQKTVSPLELRILLACYYTSDPAGEFDAEQWDCSPARAGRETFRREGLMNESGYGLTEKGHAYIDEILATPFPVEVTTWHFPRGDR